MIVASNFKTNHTRKETALYLDALKKYVTQSKTAQEVRVYPSFTALDCFELPSNIKVGAQNFYPVPNGSYTGEIGSLQLDEFGVRSVLIGHSERRHVLGESQEEIAQKFAFALKQGWEIVYCVGEPKEVREEGLDAVIAYVEAQFEGINLNYEKLVVAYEPVWAIGTGLTASTNDIKETHGRLREKVSAPLLYGGSVKVANAQEVMGVENCDGVLVGTASWNVEDFCEMIAAADLVSK